MIKNLQNWVSQIFYWMLLFESGGTAIIGGGKLLVNARLQDDAMRKFRTRRVLTDFARELNTVRMKHRTPYQKFCTCEHVPYWST